MGRSQPVLDLSSDAVDRLFARAPLPPLLLGGVITLSLVALYAAVSTLTGELPDFLAGGGELLTARDARLAVIIPLLVGYAPAAQRILAVASRRNLAELGRATGRPLPQLEPLGRRRLVMGLALLLVPLTALAIDREIGLYFEPRYWGGAQVCNWLAGALLCAGVARFGHATFGWSRAFAKSAPRASELDLFERAWLAPFARQGLLCALLWLVIPALFAGNLGDAPFVLVSLPLTLGCVGIGFAALWLPTAGVRRSLVDAKRAELSRVHGALRGDRAALEGLGVRHEPEPSLADLLAYERFLQGLPTTPFEQASWIRFGLYLALPIGSWLGGALVERAISSILD